jgi:hypothetical protein
MRVSVLNFVSRELDMLKFSTQSALDNAGTDDFDYIVFHWRAEQEVREYLENHPRVIPVEYKEDSAIGFVPNLRRMMNMGFKAGYAFNDYVALTNTDVYHSEGWLSGLVKYAQEDLIVNSTHVTPIYGEQWVQGHFGLPTEATFDLAGFLSLREAIYEQRLESEKERGGWGNCSTMPYLVHQKWWGRCGPWDLQHVLGEEPPDRRFFQRCSKAGAKFAVSKESIIYHHEAVERYKGPPKGAEYLTREP